MIVKIIQTKTNFDMQWDAVDTNGHTVFIAKSPYEIKQFNINIDYKGDFKEQRLYFNPSDHTWGTKLVDRLSFRLFEQNEKVATLVGQTKKLGFLKSYPYYKFEYKNETYYGYEVGFGRHGLYLCIYRGEELIAIVEKELTTTDYHDTYIAYIENKNDLTFVAPFVLYYDSLNYDDLLEISVKSRNTRIVNTIQPELIGKYDGKFVEKIKKETENNS